VPQPGELFFIADACLLSETDACTVALMPAHEPDRDLGRVPEPPRRAPADPAAIPAAIGNQAMGRLLQRFVSSEADKAVYIPSSFGIGGEFQKSLSVLLGPHQINHVPWERFRQVAWPDAKWKVPQAEAVSWGKANLGKGLNPEERQPAPAEKSEDVEATTEGNVRAQFLDERNVHQYPTRREMQYGEPSDKTLLLEPKDMREKGDDLGALSKPEACVIQALEDFGVEVPGTSTHTAADWHRYCTAQKPQIDYRTDSHYIRLYVEQLGYQMVNNDVVAWTSIDWKKLGGDGRYLAGTYPGGSPGGSEVGHMIGVVVSGGKVTTVHDQQGLTKPHLAGGNVHARYIFKL
jgi:hypothetical protein